MKKNIKTFASVVLLLTLFISACKKYSDIRNDISGDRYIHARALYFDNITGEGTTGNPIGNLSAYLSYPSTPINNYLYSLKADMNGYFTFFNLSDSTYNITADTLLSNIRYSGSTSITLKGASIDTATLFLYPDEKSQNGIVITIMDSLKSGVIANATVCLFSNSTLVNDSCANSNYSSTSNGAGKVSFLNIPPHAYTAVARLKSGNIVLLGKDQIVVDNSGIKRRSILLK